MPTFTVQASGSTAVAKNHPNTNYSDLTQYKFFVEPFTGDAGNIKRGDNVYINFPVPGDTYKFKRVTKVTLAFYAQPTAESDATYKGIWTYVNALASQFDADAMTYATRPEIYQTFTGVSEQANGNWTALNEIIQLNAVFDLKNYIRRQRQMCIRDREMALWSRFEEENQGQARRLYSAQSQHGSHRWCASIRTTL